jgi:HK97 family phage major capsid protein
MAAKPAAVPEFELRTISALSAHEKKHFSLVRLLEHECQRAERALANHSDRDAEMARRLLAAQNGLVEPQPQQPVADQAPDCLEREVHAALVRELGPAEHGGCYLPIRLRSGLATTTDAAGGYTIGSDVKDIVDYLTAQSRVLQLGAQLIPSLQGNTSFPREVTAPSATWVAENPGSDVAQADVQFAVTVARPRMLSGTTSYSRKLLAQSSAALETWLRKRLARTHAVTLDKAALAGTGSANQPLGLLRTAGIGDVAIGATGGAPTSAVIHDLVRLVSDSNSDSVNNAFLSTPVMRTKLSGIARFSGSALPLWDGNTMIGYPAAVSSNVPSTLVKSTSSDCHGIIFGSWENMLIGEWGVIEIVVDPYSLKKQGMIEVTSYQTVDVIIVRPSAFSACQDARNV